MNLLEELSAFSKRLKMGTFGALYVVYDEPRWIRYSLASIYSQCEAVLLLVGVRPWNGPYYDNSSTLREIYDFPDPDKKITLVRGEWPSETEQRNSGLDILRQMGIDYALIIDGDELYDVYQLTRLMIFASCLPDVVCWCMRMYTYWKSVEYRIDPLEDHAAAVLMRLGEGRFGHLRSPDTPRNALVPPRLCICHHMSYAKSDEEVLRKLASFGHAQELAPEWFEKVWKAWDRTPEMRFLNPVTPSAYDHVVRQPVELLPAVVRENLAALANRG